MVVVQLSANRSLGSRAIQAYLRAMGHTFSEEHDFSHFDFVLPGGQLLGALVKGGVQVHESRSDYTRVQRFAVPHAPIEVYELAKSQLGKPYDWTALFGIGFRRDWQEDDSWECTELGAWCFLKAGTPILRTDKVARITPPMIALSPLLVPVY